MLIPRPIISFCLIFFNYSIEFCPASLWMVVKAIEAAIAIWIYAPFQILLITSVPFMNILSSYQIILPSDFLWTTADYAFCSPMSDRSVCFLKLHFLLKISNANECVYGYYVCLWWGNLIWSLSVCSMLTLIFFMACWTGWTWPKIWWSWSL